MEYDFIVEAGADYSQIKIAYEGAESISLNDNGELVIETKWGEVVEQKPVIYQDVNNARVPVVGEYSLNGDNTFGFKMTSNYDKNLPLVIDPALVYSTYLGGSKDIYNFFAEEVPNGIAVDASGAAYVAGYTTAINFPMFNSYQGTIQGYMSGFVTKLSSSGNSLIYSTYFGGIGADGIYGIAVDASGAVYLTGSTSSTNFPLLNSYQETLNGTNNAFVTKLSSSGNSLIYSTYLGGSGIDYGNSIAVDASGAAYLTGSTSSSDFPMLNPYQGTNQGFGDAFVTKLSSSGNSLIYSTYLGGSSNDYVFDIAVDASGAAYVTGQTLSTDFPKLDPYQGTKQIGYDVFVTKLSSSGNSLIYSTYLGGSGNDYCNGIAVDASGSAYIIGYTSSIDFPMLNPYQGTKQGADDAFITKFSSSGNSLVYSTYLGGSDYDRGTGIAVDASGAAYLTGMTYSTNFPTLNPYQGTNHGNSDAFMTKLSSSGNSLIYSTYLGGSGSDGSTGIAVDASGATYLMGMTYSTNFPTLNPY